MYSKLVLFFLIIVVGGFFYLHTINPAEVNFVIAKDRAYVFPVTVVVFAGFFLGAALVFLLSLFVDARRAIADMRLSREKKQRDRTEKDYRDGVAAILKGSPAKAVSLLEKAFAQDKKNIDIPFRLAEAYLEDGKPQEAMRLLEGLLLKNSGNIEVLSAIADYAGKIGDTFKAEETLKEIVALDPGNPHALGSLRDMMVENGEWQRAADYQKTLVSRLSDGEERAAGNKILSGLTYESAAATIKNGEAGEAEKLDEALGKAKGLVKSDESFVPGHILLGDIQLRKGRASDARKTWERAYGSRPDPALFLRIEELYLKESRPQEIIEKYRAAVSERPGDTDLRLLAARLYLRLEMVDDAIEELERLGQEGEDGFYREVLLGEAYLRRDQGGKAANIFRKALGKTRPALDKELAPPFICSGCKHGTLDWQARCRVCGDWNTLVMSRDTSVNSEKETVAG
ncbi:MAG: tetratricopeptide repeat protein [Thermodesulfobacteriota bacterium]